MVRKGKELNFDDTIQCRYYSRNKYREDDWEKLCNNLNDTITNISKGYLWNRDEFKIILCSPLHGDKIDVEHFISTTCFGDNIEDEWFIVHLIYELTRLYDDLIVHVEDSDGYFLLIEAANYLPHWLNPDNADNRVFIYQNNIHLINPDLVSLDMELDICSAVKIIIDHPDKTKASCEIQTAIHKKISGYPEKIEDTTHRAIVSLPVEVATILKLKPSFISPIVNTYCNHDMLEAKICKEINYKDCIDVSITFTKFLYAMLLHGRLGKDRKNNVTADEEKKKTLGYKLTCGYEIIMGQSSKDIYASYEYKKFLNRLTETGYFKNNMEGSQEYNVLLEKAKSYFLAMECPTNKYICTKISNMKKEEAFHNLKNMLIKGDNPNLIEDDDNWLNITPDELNNVLASRFGTTVTMKDEINSSQNITSALTKFLNKNSDFEGIEKVNEHSDNNKIELDPDEFTQCLEKYLNIVTSNDTFELSDDDEYSDMDDEVSQQLDKELRSVLSSLPESDHHAVKGNLVQSIKEEGLSGPSSNILKTIGIKKTDLLDSDDDE